MATYPAFIAPGYSFEAKPDLSDVHTRERLSQSAVDGFFAIMDRWRIPQHQQGELLGGLSRSMLHRMKTGAGIRTQDELTRISYIVGIYKALHILLDDDLADSWMTRPNSGPLFRGHTPLHYTIRLGIPGLENVRGLLDAARGGQ